MELLRLRYFVALAETENLTQTASDLHISPSSLSLTIAKLEKELGTTLFDRTGRKLQLNDTGRELFQRLRNLLAELDLALSKAMQKNTLSIVMGLPAAWSSPLSDFAKLMPEVHISTRLTNRSTIEREILSDNYDFWLATSDPTEYADVLEIRRLSSPALFLAVPESSELAKKESVSFQEIKDENFMFPIRTYSLYDTFIEICEAKKFEPKIIANCSFYVRMKMVADGLGVTFVDSYTRDYDLFKRVAFVKISDAPPLHTHYICWRKDIPLTPTAQEFLDYITLYYQDV